MVPARHFLSSIDLNGDQLEEVIGRAIELKAMHRAGQAYTPLDGQTVAIVEPTQSNSGASQAPHTNIARLICEMAVLQLGALLPSTSINLDAGANAAHWSGVLGNLFDGFVAVGVEHRSLESFAKHSRASVVNHSSDRFLPCRWLADLQTYREHRGSLRGRRVVWIGRASPTCRTFIQGTARMGYSLVISSPAKLGPEEALVRAAGTSVSLQDDPLQAVQDADLLITDESFSDGVRADVAAGNDVVHRLTSGLVAQAKNNALVIQHLASNVHDPVVERQKMQGDDQMVISKEAAENQLHVQKALLEKMLVG